MTPEVEKQYKEVIGILLDAVKFYADPESYHAIMFVPDRPAGRFADDFERDHGHTFYEREMPGKYARDAIMEVVEKYPDLHYLDFE